MRPRHLARGVERRSNRHVVHRIGGSRQKAAHSATVVEAVGTPERWKLIARPILRTLTETIPAVTCRAGLGIDLRAVTWIGSAHRFFDLQRAGADQLRTVGDTG